MSETRGGRVLVSVLPLMLLACAAFGVALFYLVRPPTGVRVGRLSEFPPSADPYAVTVANQRVFVAVTGMEVLVIEPRFATSNAAWNCEVKWVPTNGRFEDPCSGAKFTLTGEWIEVSYLTKTIDSRGLGRYPVEVRGDELWVTSLTPAPGRLVATACYGDADC